VADLIGANLSKANLTRAKLTRAKLSEADFTRANLFKADLSGARLVNTDLSGARLGGAKFREADLTSAGLKSADLSGAYLSGADFAGASLGWTLFSNSDLRLVKNLDQMVHKGPSYISLDTIYLSRGQILAAFLRGTGVPDNFITFMKPLTASPVEFYSCFISYSSTNQDFAERLHADFQAAGIRCWFAPEDVKGGKKLHEQIDEAIRVYDKLLLILSPASMSSEWVKTEIAKARRREGPEKCRMLFPITLVPYSAIQEWECFDADAGKDTATEIREYFIPDFSNWQDYDSYRKAFNRLVGDLKAAARS
jgi:TIR domain/Pentapeptide repeats (8 copies)